MELGLLIAFIEFKIVPLFAFLGLILEMLSLKNPHKGNLPSQGLFYVESD